ncbi:hypothetical protein I5Q34_09375 [Streptomyces sp. AV19]|uniref:prenyltransferase/squalene oxidase repeat-containing protein n=1 Tax=Streptomyces sp. AV19 TaxID=2793068 RepID=UPI0018FE3A1B|nr:prenyltransferase/squalene oxidase repeat-containing protein [Streptomyces sp. AV19]MBH1934494.1 hypothetical protein [Streptomyces sp. AV19]MDG4533288.1 hypothetical protein [Streptomyces sp. AV19]
MRVVPVATGLPYWPDDVFPADLAPATARLLVHLRSRVGADGAVREPCRSRVLESALTLALLDRTGRHPTARRRITNYLAEHRDSPDPLDRLLTGSVLGGRPTETGPPDMNRFLARAPDFTGLRKRAFLDMVLLLAGALPTAPPPAPEAFSPHGLHTWARVQNTAVKAVLAHARGQLHSVSERELDLLRSTQRAGTVWEGNILVHLSVLHALASLPEEGRLVADGVATALEHQRPDGGMPFICEEDTWATATAGIALHAAAAPRSDLTAVAGRLLRLQQPGGGWSFSERARLADVDCTSVAVEVLHLTDPRAHHAPIRRGLAALNTLRGQDGGYPTYVSGAPSEACMTAAAVNALSTRGPEQRTAVADALGFLASQQNADGSFPPDWSRSRLHTVFRATLAAARHPRARDGSARRIGRRAGRLVLASQNADGGWGQQDGARSDALSTAYALITLSRHREPGPAVRGVAHLLAQQRPDGSVASVPDSVGPRPFGFTIPVLADIFALLALGHLTRRIQPGGSRRAPSHPPHAHGSDHAHHGPEPTLAVPGDRGHPAF